MDIGAPRRIIEVEPVDLPIPETIPEPIREPEPVPVPERPAERASRPSALGTSIPDR